MRHFGHIAAIIADYAHFIATPFTDAADIAARFRHAGPLQPSIERYAATADYLASADAS